MEARDEIQDETHAVRLEGALRAERAGLVRWCAHLTGNADVAEDLAQETYSAAWRSVRRPERPEEYGAWLAGIARNMCRSWRRRQQREMTHTGGITTDEASDGDHERLHLADTVDLADVLERKELALLLDHALALLPVETRQALVAKYIEEAPLAEVAAHMGVSESALAARLHRGKRALRRVLATTLRDEATSYGLVEAEDDEWRETHIWCPMCATRRFAGRLMPDADAFALRCPQCYARDHVDFASWRERGLFHGLSSHRAALSRLSRSAHAFYRRGLNEGTAPCIRCGGSALTRRARPEEASEDFRAALYLRVLCVRCGAMYSATLSGLLLCSPPAQRFWRDHPRVLTLPDREIEYDSHQAALTSFVSWDGVARLDIISDPQTFAVWRISGDTVDRDL